MLALGAGQGGLGEARSLCESVKLTHVNAFLPPCPVDMVYPGSVNHGKTMPLQDNGNKPGGISSDATTVVEVDSSIHRPSLQRH